MVIDRHSTVQRNRDVVARELAEGEGGVLLHLGSGAYHGVNQVGLMVWQLIDGERTVEQLVVGVRDQVGDAPLEIEQDIVAFLAKAAQRDLIIILD